MSSSQLPLFDLTSFQTEEALYMRPGKGDRLETCDCASRVTIPVKDIHTIDREVDIMHVEADRIEIAGKVIHVRVDSLNQAYTVASRRLESSRRSHGGRTYNHLVHVGPSERMLLETIRLQVENGDWEVPPSPTHLPSV